MGAPNGALVIGVVAGALVSVTRLAAMAILLAACIPAPPHSLSGVWRAEVHEANAPQPIVVLTFGVMFAELPDGQVVGLAYIRGRSLTIWGRCDAHLCRLTVSSGNAPAHAWVVWPDAWGFDGRILAPGFSYGVVRLRPPD